jgi:lysozyme
MKPSQACVDLVKEFEGFRPTAYICPAGVLTIGYGTTEDVSIGDEVTREEAEEMLMEDLLSASKAIDDLVDVELTQHQYDALVSFVYNVGREAFKNSTLLRLLNAGNYDGAAKQLPRWNKGGGRVLAGLTRRREAEQELFTEVV